MSVIRKSFASILIAVLVLVSSFAGRALAGVPTIASVSAPVRVGASFKVAGSGFSAGAMVNFFVSTAMGAVNEGPLKPAVVTSTSLTVAVPANVPLGLGAVAVQVVNTDQGFAASNVSYALLLGSANAGIPSITAINGVGLAASSINPKYAIDNVETVVAQGSDVILQGSGFDLVNGVAVDVFCACPGGKVGPFFISPGDRALSATSVRVSLPASGAYALPVGPATFVVSNRGNGSYIRKSNAVSAPVGRRIAVVAVRQQGATLILDGTGLSTLTVINYFTRVDGNLVNLGGLTPSGAPAIRITLVSDTELTFKAPASASAGAVSVQALNPPFVPFSTSGWYSFTLVDAAPSPTAAASAKPTAVKTPIGPILRATPTPGRPTASSKSTARPTASATARPALAVLLSGGADNTVSPGGSHPTLASAETYDAASGTFRTTGSMAVARLGHTVTMLNNGKVLIAGGHNSFSPRSVPSAELYDVKSGSFTMTGSMNSARLGHSAVLLKNGKVFVAGGQNVNFATTDVAELYDPATEQFSPTASLLNPRSGHMVVVLKDRRVLVAGGADDHGLLSSAEIYDANGYGSAAVGAMSTVRQNATATVLQDGRVLITGGASQVGTCTGCATDSAELFDPRTRTFSATGRLHAHRKGHSATLLPNGKVLISGGLDDINHHLLASAEIYDPTSGTFAAATTMKLGRFDHNATALANGKVLISGGFTSLSIITNTAELYNPATSRFSLTGTMTDARAEDGAASFAAPTVR